MKIWICFYGNIEYIRISLLKHSVFIMCLVLRDMRRGRDLEQILTQYTTFVKPAFEEFCLPVRKHTAEMTCESRVIVMWCIHDIWNLSPISQTKKYADVIIPRGVDNMGKYESKGNKYSKICLAFQNFCFLIFFSGNQPDCAAYSGHPQWWHLQMAEGFCQWARQWAESKEGRGRTLREI